MALNLGGGGTRWETSRTLRYYLEKYHQFDASSGSLGMDDVRVEAFRKMLERHLERGLWCRMHYHCIGEGLSSSEANFRAALDIAKDHEKELWIAGMADIYQYQTARNAAALRLGESDTGQLSFRLECGTDPELYDQPLTIEIEPPPSWNPGKIRVSDAGGNLLEVEAMVPDGEDTTILRLPVPAAHGAYSVMIVP